MFGAPVGEAPVLQIHTYVSYWTLAAGSTSRLSTGATTTVLVLPLLQLFLLEQ